MNGHCWKSRGVGWYFKFSILFALNCQKVYNFGFYNFFCIFINKLFKNVLEGPDSPNLLHLSECISAKYNHEAFLESRLIQQHYWNLTNPNQPIISYPILLTLSYLFFKFFLSWAIACFFKYLFGVPHLAPFISFSNVIASFSYTIQYTAPGFKLKTTQLWVLCLHH